MKVRFWGVAALPLVVASCGGGGGETTGITVTATPTPTAVATPTPTPTPAPVADVPSPAYDLASDFSRDRSFSAIGVTRTEYRPLYVSAGSVSPESATIGFDFTAATRMYRLRYAGSTGTVVTQTEQSIDGINDRTSAVIEPTDSRLSFLRSSWFGKPRYLGYVNWLKLPPGDGPALGTRHMMVFGARTVSGDIPLRGVSDYRGYVQPYGFWEGRSGPSKITIDYDSRQVRIETEYSDYASGSAGSSINAPPPTKIYMVGTVDLASGRLNGTVEFEGSSKSGTFEGAVYGPRASEAGIAFQFDDGSFIGALYGIR